MYCSFQHDDVVETFSPECPYDKFSNRVRTRPTNRCGDGVDRQDHPHKWNNRRLHSAIGDIPPTEYEVLYYQQREAAEAA
jgi:hypothetical protein